MKKIISTTFLFTLITVLFAQVPQKMSYQAVVRNSSGVLVKNATVGVRISILKDSANGRIVYSEVYSPLPKTNINGLVTLEIGGGLPVSGTFSTIDWSKGPYFIKTETDPNGGTNYSITGTSQFLSVPYALYAGNIVNTPTYGGKTYLVLSGDITDADAVIKIANEVGPNTQFVLIQNTSKLTTVDLSSIVNLVDLIINDNAILSSVNVSSIANIETSITIARNPTLSSLNFQTLISAGPLNINNNPKITSILFPALRKLSSYCIIAQNPDLTTLNFNVLNYVSDIIISGNPSLSNIGFSDLENVYGGIQITNTNASSISFPDLSVIKQNVNITNNSNLTSVSMPSLTKCPITLVLQSNKLTSSVVNLWLAQLITLSPPSGTNIVLNKQTPPAPPTGQGISDKATLISNGLAVATD